MPSAVKVEFVIMPTASSLATAHYNDVIMSAMASPITSPTSVQSTVYSRRRSKETSKLCAGIHRSPVNSPHKGPVTRKMFPFEDVIMKSCHCECLPHICPEICILDCINALWNSDAKRRHRSGSTLAQVPSHFLYTSCVSLWDLHFWKQSHISKGTMR